MRRKSNAFIVTLSSHIYDRQRALHIKASKGSRISQIEMLFVLILVQWKAQLAGKQEMTTKIAKFFQHMLKF